MSEDVAATFVVVFVLVLICITMWRTILILFAAATVAVLVSGVVYVISMVQPS